MTLSSITFLYQQTQFATQFRSEFSRNLHQVWPLCARVPCFSKIIFVRGRILTSCKDLEETKVLGHELEQNQDHKRMKKANFAIRKRKFSQTVTKAPGSIDLMNFTNRRRIKRGTKQHSAFISLVLPIAGYNTRTQKENRENLTAIPFIANFNRLFCYDSLEGVPTLLSIGRRLDLVDNCSDKV